MTQSAPNPATALSQQIENIEARLKAIISIKQPNKADLTGLLVDVKSALQKALAISPPTEASVALVNRLKAVEKKILELSQVRTKGRSM